MPTRSKKVKFELVYPASHGGEKIFVSKRKSIHPETLKKVLSYNKNDGILTWLHRNSEMFDGDENRSSVARCNRWNGQFAGKVAFSCITNRGYATGKIFNVDYLAHRVIWALYTGAWPVDQIDHIDGNKLNNRIENLRECSQSQNMHNIKISSNNTSGIKGVRWNKKNKTWIARIKIDGKEIHLGSFSDLSLAVQKRKQETAKYHKEFARVS